MCYCSEGDAGTTDMIFDSEKFGSEIKESADVTTLSTESDSNIHFLY